MTADSNGGPAPPSPKPSHVPPSSRPSFPSCTILWSTQSGRAKACARRAARMAKSRGVSVLGRRPPPSAASADDRRSDGGDVSVAVPSSEVGGGGGGFGYGCAFDEYGPTNFLNLGRARNGGGGCEEGETTLLVMFVSTTGDAEQCDSIRQTWTALLHRSLPRNQFSNVKFALFALGDRAYGPSAFCAAGRKLAARLVQLGATPACPVGYGDDGTPNGGVFADLDGWLDGQFLPFLGGEGCGATEDVGSASPYRVERFEEEAEGVSGNAARSGERMEWQSEQYREHFDKFFSSLCPATAYRYDNRTGERAPAGDGTTPIQCPPLTGRVTSNERITAADWMQDTRHIRIDVQATETYAKTCVTDIAARRRDGAEVLPYQAGDVATIMPSNSAHSVNQFLDVLPAAVRSTADVPIEISFASDTGGITPWPRRCTLRGLLTHCADINALPEREDLRALSRFCRHGHGMGVDQRDKLLSLSETEGAALYGDYILREKRKWGDVLYDFDSIRWEDGGEDAGSGSTGGVPLTLEGLLSILPPMNPRHFSIASAPSVALTNRGRIEPDSGKGIDGKGRRGFTIELCVAIVKGKTIRGRPYEGLCSGYLSRLTPDDDDDAGRPPVRLWMRPGSFGKLPLNPLPSGGAGAADGVGTRPHRHFETPVMCVGAGTGVAPLRSLLQEREASRVLAGGDGRRASPAGRPGDSSSSIAEGGSRDNVLVFGCRRKASDFYYATEWNRLVESHRLRLVTAFSRDQRHKLYVQRALREADGGLLLARHLLEDGGAVYVAGGAKMARAVKDEIVECLAGWLEGGERDAKALLKRLQRAGRFSVEAWS